MQTIRRIASWQLVAALTLPWAGSCSSPPPESVPSAETLPERQAVATASINADTPVPARPATVADAQKVLDLTTFPLVPGSEAPQRQVAGVTYNAPGSVTEVFDFYVKQFASGGWQELPGSSRTADACNASFLKQGFQVAFTVYGAAKPGTSSVNLVQLGNVALERLPVPRGSSVVYAGPAVAMYSTNASPEDTKLSVRELLAAAGWQSYGKAGDVDFYKQNAIRLSANIAAAPGLQGKTAISYSAELMSADLPAPTDVLDLQYSDSTKQLLFDTMLDKQAILDFYRPLLAKTGWEPTHDKLLESGFKEFMIFRNPAKDLLEIETWEVDGKRRVTVEFQTAAEVAEEERRMKEEMERRKKEQEKEQAQEKQSGLNAPLSWDEYSDERLEAELNKGRTVLVFFSAPWCQPCRVLKGEVLSGHEFGQFARREKLVTLECNVEDHAAYARRLRIMSIPRTAIYVAGNSVPADVIENKRSTQSLIEAVTMAKDRQVEQPIGTSPTRLANKPAGE